MPEAGFIRLRCLRCGIDKALAFSSKGRGLCASCGARRMHDIAQNRSLGRLPVASQYTVLVDTMVGENRQVDWSTTTLSSALSTRSKISSLPGSASKCGFTVARSRL